MICYALLFALLCVWELVSALQVDITRDVSGGFVQGLDGKSVLQGRGHEEDPLLVLLFRRTPTKPSSSKKSTPPNVGMRRSQSHPDLVSLAVSGGGVKAKPRNSADQVRPRSGQLMSSGGSSRRSQGSDSSRRTIRYESRPQSRASLAALVGGGSSGGLIRSQSSGTLSSGSYEDSPPRSGARGFLHSSNLANSPRSTQDSLSGSSVVMSPVGSLRSHHSGMDESMGGSEPYSIRLGSPSTPRSSEVTSLGSLSPIGSSATQPSVSGMSPSLVRQQTALPNLLRIHDSPSSISSARVIADPLRRNIRPRLSSAPPQTHQLQPESPASRVGSTLAEVGSSDRSVPSDYGSGAESLDSRFQRMRFNQ